VAQGRGEHSRTTIKTVGADGFGISHIAIFDTVNLMRGSSSCSCDIDRDEKQFWQMVDSFCFAVISEAKKERLLK
jgi:hypothetical protein